MKGNISKVPSFLSLYLILSSTSWEVFSLFLFYALFIVLFSKSDP
jgi:hypothetical protein